ncbi:unnamed protein product, partial [Prunus brigantina]
ANLTAWCSGLRGCALTRDVLLLDAVRLCAGVPARYTVRRDGDEVRVEDVQVMRLIYKGSPGGPIEAEKICMVAEKICMVESDRGKWVVKSAFGIVKHGGVTPINLGKSRPPP